MFSIGKMSQFLHDDDAKAIAIPWLFSENSHNKNGFWGSGDGLHVIFHRGTALRPLLRDYGSIKKAKTKDNTKSA